MLERQESVETLSGEKGADGHNFGTHHLAGTNCPYQCTPVASPPTPLVPVLLHHSSCAHPTQLGGGRLPWSCVPLLWPTAAYKPHRGHPLNT